MKVWIAGREARMSSSDGMNVVIDPWELLGICTTQDKATKICKKPHDFISGPVNIDEDFDKDRNPHIFPNTIFPIKESEEDEQS
jgi:hypothetical protein